MFSRAVTIGRVGGVAVRVDISWLAIAALVTWSFWGRFAMVRDYDTGRAVAMAVVGALLFFGSVLGHELAHALEARHRGVEVSGITLFLFGGVTEMKFDVERPRDEFALTAVGPYTSFVLAAAFGLVATGAERAGAVHAAEVAGLLGWLNLALGVFNLLPGAPLDGGRILRSAVWAVTGDRYRAIRAAATTGRILGALILGFGVFQLFFLPGALVGGLWFMFIGWFLMRAAMAEQGQAELRGLLSEVKIRRLLPPVSGVPVTASVEEAVDALYRTHGDHMAVVDGDRGVVGVVSADRIRQLSPDERARTTVSAVMHDLDAFPAVGIDDELHEVLDRFAAPSGAVVVTEAGRVAGILTEADIATAARRADELSGPRRRGMRR